MNIFYIILYIAIALVLLWVGYGYFSVRNIEEPAYSVLEKKDGYEIREYEPYIIATVEIEGTYEQALTDGFRLIADYIFGNNTGKEQIAMTAPVQETEPEKIAMTVPVLETENSSTVRSISFVMPSKYTIENIPKPNNKRVVLREVPQQRVAALSFSWGSGAGRVASKKEELLDLLKRDSAITTGTPYGAFYNPPFTPPFMKRNEILITIE